MRLTEPIFNRPIAPLSNNAQETVYFPCDDEASSNGLVSIAWRGPRIERMRELIALDVLFYYLTDSSISPLHAHFINAKSYCNRVSYKIDEYRQTCLSISFFNTQLEHLDAVRSEFFQLLDDLFVTRKTPFDTKRLANIIKMKITDIDDKVSRLGFLFFCVRPNHERNVHLNRNN